MLWSQMCFLSFYLPHLLLVILQITTEASLELLRKPPLPPPPPGYDGPVLWIQVHSTLRTSISGHIPLHLMIFSVSYVRLDPLKVRSVLCEHSEPLAMAGIEQIINGGDSITGVNEWMNDGKVHRFGYMGSFLHLQ